jgi:uncharacterized membrane protein
MILKDREREDIAHSIARVEAKTSCRILCCLTEEDFYYPLPAFLLAGAIAVILSFLIWLIGIDLGTITHTGWSVGTHGHRVASSMTQHRLRATFVVTSTLLILAYPVILMPPISRLLTPLRLRQRRITRAAIVQYNVEARRETADKLDLLIFVSPRDRLADMVSGPRIQAKLPVGVWNEPKTALNAALKTGKIAAGLLETIETLAAILSVSLPKHVRVSSVAKDPWDILGSVREI